MKTLENALQELEFISGGKRLYEINFPDSELRKNPEETAKFVKSQLESFRQISDKKMIDNCLNLIEEYVCGKENIGNSKFRGEYGKNYIDDGLKYCDIILTRIAESKHKEGDKLTINDLNEKYKYEFLVFNGDEDGVKIAFVTDIHYFTENKYSNAKTGNIVMDGTIIDICNENHENGDGVLIYEVEDYDFKNFWYFDGYSSTDELDKALQMRPCDTDYKTHVISGKQVAAIIIASIRWGIEMKTRHIWLTKIFEYLEATIDEDIKENDEK